MNNQVAIKIQGLKKRYRLGQIGRGTLTEDLQTLWARIRKKEDPYSTIGALKRVYGQTFMALDGIDLTIHAGEAIGIIGSNGAGKSTMLKILSRITAPSAGTVDIYGRITSMLEVGTGFSPEMTGRENIYMNGAILGMTKSEIDEKIDDIIEFSEIRDFIDTPVKRYSSGMYVKLAFSVAAHLDSEIMIMDEVLAVGDMNFQKKCLDKMRDAAKAEGRTVLYVSHNMNTIRNLCDRCIVLDKGKIIFDGDVESAISIYMQNKFNPLQTEFDLSQRTFRGRNPALIPAKIMNIKLTDVDCASYTASSPIMLDMQINARKDMENLHLRIELHYGDDTPIGAVPDIPLGNMKNGEDKTFSLSFTPTGITRGTYRVDLALFQKNDFDNALDVDMITEAFGFDITEENGTVWNPNKWGHIRFEGAEVVEKTETNNG